MLDFVFGFRLRLTRINYFLSWIAVASLMTLISLAIAGVVFHLNPPGTEISDDQIAIPVICILPVFLWVTCNVQSMRIRDMGWNPAYVIPAWVLVIAADKVLAIVEPTWSVGEHHNETAIGVFTNFALTVALLFWPSAPDDASVLPPIRKTMQAPPASPPAPTLAPSPQFTKGFGRRGL